MPLHTQREEDIKEVEDDFVKWVHEILPTDRELKIKLRSIISSYNKQLLDGIEGEIKELPTESVYDHEGGYYYGTTRKKDILSILNKYRV